MAFKQPRVPEYRESEGTGKYIRSLVLFLKDFCMDVWMANNQRTGEISDAVKGYPVTSVCGKTGDVALTAADVGALPSGGTAVNASKLGGKTMAQLLLTVYPVGSIYLSVNSTSPASLFGGSWEQLKDRFLLGAGNSYTAGSKGGSANRTLEENHIPPHNHNIRRGADNAVGSTWESYAPGSGESVYGTYLVSSDSRDAASAFSIMPPYLAVYMWKRVS